MSSAANRIERFKDWSGGSWLNVFQVLMAAMVPVVITAVIFLFYARTTDQQDADARARKNTCTQAQQSHAAELGAFRTLIENSQATTPEKLAALGEIQVLQDAYTQVEIACFHAASVAGGGR